MKYLAMTLVLAVGSTVLAEAPNSLSDAEKNEGWQLLFDGKSLDGWNSWKTKKPLAEGAWKVEDGALTLSGKGGGDVYTSKPFENFELYLEWKTTGNSGILFRVDPTAKGPIYGVAPEMQVNSKAGNSNKSPGALYDLYANEVDTVVNDGDWNTVRVRLVDGEGTHWFNGKKVYSYKIGSDDWNKRIAGSKWKNSKGYAETANGHVGLQDHGAKVSYRNIKIRPL
ncbi:MAG: DUF1080 domain-containing protein [Pirellulales bacterium]|nr:DUF1080 domain-containing protein [Pirellulales bacterium]